MEPATRLVHALNGSSAAVCAADCPRLVPQVTRMVTGMDDGDPRFSKRWVHFLREVGAAVQEASRESGRGTSTS